MKQVTTPPKTGEEFVVLFNGDGLEHWTIRYNKEYEVFERKHSQLGWIAISSKESERRYLKNVLIFVYG